MKRDLFYKGCFHELVLEIEKRVFLSLYSKFKKGGVFFLLVLGVLVCNFLFLTQS